MTPKTWATWFIDSVKVTVLDPSLRRETTRFHRT
jgi:hypothetical protein